MAGFEVIVRPVVFPDIRPRPRPSLPPEDDPTKGFGVIQGNPTVSTSGSYSMNISWSISRPVETERRVDETRVYQQEDDGTVNQDNFIDIQVANRISMREGDDSETRHFYQRVEEADNIKIREKDKIIKAADLP